MRTLTVQAAVCVAAIAMLSAPASAQAAPAPPTPAAPQQETPGAQGAGSADALTWSVAPAGPKGPNGRPALAYKLDPGAELGDQVAVTNHSQRPLALRLYASDAFTTAGGGFDLLAGTGTPVDVGTWVKLRQSTLQIPARSRIVVPFTVTVPGNATPGDHVGGIVAALASTGTDADGNEVSVDHRVGTRIYLRVTGPLRPELTVSDMKTTKLTSWNPLRLPAVTATFIVHNTGNVRLTGKSLGEANSPLGLGQRKVDGAAVPEILPGGSVRATVRVDGILPLIRAWVTAGVEPSAVDEQVLEPAPSRAAARASTWLIPWPQLALLIILAAAATLWIAMRRRGRRKVAAALEAAERRGRDQARLDPSRPQSTDSQATKDVLTP